ncbi:MAG: hypothetical protein M1836_001669 [Candelina mexicana]|nr:MAG: hypothetical protein M1836_001669 [Candelina mexicana]
MHLRLSPLSPSDLPDLITSQYRAFASEQMHEALFGPDTAEMHAVTKQRHEKELATDPSSIWLKVTDLDTGKLMSAANWKVWPGFAPTGGSTEGGKSKESEVNGTDGTKGTEAEEEKTAPGGFATECTWWTGSEREQAEAIVRDFVKRRARHVKEACVLLHILFTDPSYQKLGAGAMMVKWGTDLADHLMLPAWVEASEVAAPLYRKNGFEDVEHCRFKTKKWDTSYWVMRRPVKVWTMEGKFV